MKMTALAIAKKIAVFAISIVEFRDRLAIADRSGSRSRKKYLDRDRRMAPGLLHLDLLSFMFIVFRIRNHESEIGIVNLMQYSNLIVLIS